MSTKRKVVSIPALRTQSPDDLLSKVQISNAFSGKPTRSIDSDLKSLPFLPPECSHWSPEPKDRLTAERAYTGYSRLSKSPHAKFSSTAVLRYPSHDSHPFTPAPQISTETPGAKERAVQLWVKGAQKRSKVSVRCKQKMLKNAGGLRALDALLMGFQSVTSMVGTR